MKKYEVLTAFNDLENGNKRIETGQVVELTEERYEQMVDNAKFYGGIETFLKPVADDEDKEENKKAKKKEPKK